MGEVVDLTALPGSRYPHAYYSRPVSSRLLFLFDSSLVSYLVSSRIVSSLVVSFLLVSYLVPSLVSLVSSCLVSSLVSSSFV